MSHQDKGKRVRGAKQVKERGDWRHQQPHGEWIERLNAVRRRLGDRAVADLLGYSTKDPTYKSVRRLAAGQRVPNQQRVSEVNVLFDTLFAGIKTIHLPPEIRGEIVGTMTTINRNRLEAFLLRLGRFAYRFDPPRGITPSVEAAERMNTPWGHIYIQAVDEDGNAPTDRQNVAVLIMVLVEDKRKGGIYTEARILNRIEETSEGLLKNAIDTNLESKIPRNAQYISFVVLGVWYVYFKK